MIFLTCFPNCNQGELRHVLLYFQRDRDLELAARIGQSLLQRNHLLQERNEVMDEELAKTSDQVSRGRAPHTSIITPSCMYLPLPPFSLSPFSSNQCIFVFLLSPPDPCCLFSLSFTLLFLPPFSPSLSFPSLFPLLIFLPSPFFGRCGSCSTSW